MLSITEIEPINQKLNPALALSLSLDDTKRMESPWLRSGFSPDINTWKLILFYNGSLEEIQKEIPFFFFLLFLYSVSLPFFLFKRSIFLLFQLILRFFMLNFPVRFMKMLLPVSLLLVYLITILLPEEMLMKRLLPAKGLLLLFLILGWIIHTLILEMLTEAHVFWLTGIKVCLLFTIIFL